VPVVADHGSDVVQERCEVEQLAFGRTQAVIALESVEQRERELRDVAEVPCIEPEAGEDLLHTAQPQVGNRFHRVDLPRVALGEVVDQAFPYAIVGERDPLEVELLEHVLEHQSGGDDDLRPRGVDRRQARALGDAHCLELRTRALERLEREDVSVHVSDRAAGFLPVREVRERVDRARRAVRLARLLLAELLQRLGRDFAHVLAQALQLLERGRVRMEERLAQA
jgi:hypothetical protein